MRQTQSIPRHDRDHPSGPTTLITATPASLPNRGRVGSTTAYVMRCAMFVGAVFGLFGLAGLYVVIP